MDKMHFDVLIIGAGISGISAARHLQMDCHHKTFAILEGRQNIGGTWDLFKYPGIRSDSDMYTLGFRFRPWTGTKAIADAIARSKAFSLAGGGDTLAAIEKYGVEDGISYISTGGGAFLEFVEGKTLPAVAVLEQRAAEVRARA